MLPIVVNTNAELVVARCTCASARATADQQVNVASLRQKTESVASAKGSYGQILKSSALIGGAQVANITIGIVRTKAMAMLLGPAGFGLFGLYGSIANLRKALLAWASTAAEFGRLPRQRGQATKRESGKPRLYCEKRLSFLDFWGQPCW